MNRFFIYLGLMISPCVIAQEISSINTDRPDQSEGVYVLPKNIFQLENGFTFSKDMFADNFMIRYGILKTTELRLSSDIEKNSEKWAVDDITLSFKQRLLEEKKGLPSITLVGYGVYSPDDDNSFSTNATLAFEYTLSDKLSADANVGIQNQFKELYVTAELNYSLSDAIGFFGEYYNTISFTGEPSHNIDMGAMLLINNNLQLDLALGRSLFNPAPNFFFVTGFSYRFLPKKRK